MKREKSSNIIYWISILGMLAGIFLLLYPSGSDIWNKWRNQKLTTEYSQSMNEIDSEKIDELWNIAVDYNKNHTRNEVRDVFSQTDEYKLSQPYDKLLNLKNDNIMGYIEIPKINVKLSIGHGVGEETLKNMVGHVEGTSLPIGGESTHSVISGHRALPSAKLFTDLDQMEIGDKFYYHILDKVIAYEVDSIDTVKPEQMDYLDIVEGKDYSTLLTCTPYGINTHRLLVRGHRIPYEAKTKDDDVTFIDQIMSLDIKIKILVLAIIVIVLIILIKFIYTKIKR